MKQRLEVNESLVGKYINMVCGTDCLPVGRIVSVWRNKFVTIQPVVASENKAKMEFVNGGFAATCTNQTEQRYDFVEEGEAYEVRISNAVLKNNWWVISDKPSMYYDFNF